MSPLLAPVAFVDLTVPRATEGGKSAKEGKALEDKGKGKAEMKVYRVKQYAKWERW